MLGKIEKIELRDIWKHEVSDFTNWLAERDNFQLLAEEIGLDMQVLKTEANVGNFSADILAEEIDTEKKIIIENQLEETDHKHLGQIITYASGLEAKYIIWIFKEMREEHRKAIDWLNEITDDDLSIFAIRMELWKIGDSLPAPKFNVICSPNDWAKAIKKNSNLQNLTDTDLYRIEFYQGFIDYSAKQKTVLKISQKASNKPWYAIRIGNSQIKINLTISVQQNFIRTELYINNNKELYNRLFENKTQIETTFGNTLDWREDLQEEAKASRIQFVKEGIDIKRKENHLEAYKWLLENSEKLYEAVKNYIK
ncbi:MAG: DUF4268 domain-containing protein [Dysgonamonadaceae bacterium]|jgi:hypothetical protein|nr:DUF4268 domain-containing protein [Dysgonamonadaceae bacterium]